MQILITYDIENNALRDGFRLYLEHNQGFDYVQDSVYSKEFETEEEVDGLRDHIADKKKLFGAWDDVRIFKFTIHWHPVERKRIRFFED